MGLLDTLRDLFSRSGADDSGPAFAYRCRECDTEFESGQRHVTAARCPDCGAEDIRVADEPYLSDS